jgi:hypothetical protein
VIIPTPREGVVLVTSENANDTSQRVDALVSAGAARPTLIGAYPGPRVLPAGFVSRASNATPSADPYLHTPSMPAGSAWTIDCHIIYSGANGAGFFMFSLLGPSNTEIDWYVPAYWNTANVEVDHETSAQAPTKIAYTYGTSAAHQAALAIHGMIYPGTDGPMGLWWSQGTSNATGTRVWNGSRLTLTRVS